VPTARNEGAKIVGRARRIGWEVETGNGAQDWLWRITCPDGARVQIHSSPSDTNWFKHVINALNAHGFESAERKWEIQDEERRKQVIADDRERNERLMMDAQRKAKAVARAYGPFGPQSADPNWILGKHEVPESKRVLITPELARVLVDDHNHANRPIRLARVEYWANIMRKGAWRYTHQGGASDVDAQIQDGQHRLLAAIRENYTLDMQWSVGMPKDNFGVVDTGAGRSATDTLATKGIENSATLSGAIRLVLTYDRYGSELRSGLKFRIPNNEVYEAALRYGNRLPEAAIQATNINRHRSAPKMSKVALTAGIFMIGRKLSENNELVEEFLRGYSDGTSLEAGDARLTLRNYMFNLKSSERTRVVPVQDQLAVFIKAWNAWTNNRAVTYLSMRTTEGMPTVFLPAKED